MLDPQVKKILNNETKRQKFGIELIPSENYASNDVRKLLSSYFVNKYSEGYPKKRYYGGNVNVDDAEILAQERAKKLFGVEHANVQPYSGSPANLAVYLATCNPNDTIMGLDLTNGGHLTHGWKTSATSLFYNSIQYHLTDKGQIDYDELFSLARKHKPKLIWAGATAYVYKYDYSKFAKIADEIGAYLATDIAHIAGLIVGRVHPSPVRYAHIVTTTTHKTLRGPRGGLIMVTEKGLKKDKDLANKVDRAVFPFLQGGPHDNQTIAIAQALYEAENEQFEVYAKQIVKNASTLANYLIKGGLKLVGNTTENHMMLVDLTSTHGSGMGAIYEAALDETGLTLNKNTVPNESSSPFFPSGVRLGTPAATTRGMKEKEMKFISEIMLEVAEIVKIYQMPETKEAKPRYVKKAKRELRSNKKLKELKEKVKAVSSNFKIP